MKRAACVCAMLFGCAGAAPASTPQAAPAAPAPADSFAAAEDAPHDDPAEKDGPIELLPLLAKGTPKSAFPKSKLDDSVCLNGLELSGKHKADYDTVVGQCGTPMGMLKYVEPHEGRLHAQKDKRDSFVVKVYKDMCYRYFAVADNGIRDIDIIVLKKGGIVATDKTEQFVAVIDGDKLWCVDEDMDLEFSVEVDGRGAGNYIFGVWTRPKK